MSIISKLQAMSRDGFGGLANPLVWWFYGLLASGILLPVRTWLRSHADPDSEWVWWICLPFHAVWVFTFLMTLYVLLLIMMGIVLELKKRFRRKVGRRKQDR